MPENNANINFFLVLSKNVAKYMGEIADAMLLVQIQNDMVSGGVDDCIIGLHYENGVRHTTVETAVGGVGLYLERGNIVTYKKVD